MVLTVRSDEPATLEGVRAASERLRAASEEAAAARARVEVLLAGDDKARAAANGPLAVFVLDKSGRIDGTAGAILSRIAVDPASLTGRSIFDVCADRPAFIAGVRTALAGQETDVRLEVGGRVMETRTAPVRDREGRPSGALSVWVDVTERERAALQLRAAEERLEQQLRSRHNGTQNGNGNGHVSAAPSEEAIAAAAEARVSALREVFDGQLRALGERLSAAQAEAQQARSASAQQADRRDDQARASEQQRTSEREGAQATEIASLRAEVEAVRKDASAMRAQRDRSDADLWSMQERVRAASEEAAAARAQAEAAVRQADEARARAQVATSEAGAARIEAIEASARMRTATDEAANARGELARAEGTHRASQREAEAARERAEAAQRDADAARAAAADADERARQMAAEVERARSEVASARLDVSDMQERVTAALTEASSARAEADAAVTAGASSRQLAENSASELEVVRAERERLEGELRSVTQRLSVAVDEAARARARAQETEEHFRASTHDASAARAQVESLSREADEARKTAHAARAEAADARAARDSAETLLSDAREQLRTAMQELATLRVRADDAESRLRTAEADATDARATAETLTKQVTRSMSAIEAATAEAAAARTRAEEAERRLETLSAARITFIGDGRGELTVAAPPPSGPTHDTLTELPDRALLREKLDRAIEGARASGTPLSLILMDLDNFKDINDTFGHQTGDSILQQTAARLRELLDEVDTVARLGGDEFAVVLPGRAGEDAVEVARRILQALDHPMRAADQEFDVEASVGIAAYPDQHVEGDELLRRAEVAMYVAKRSRGGYVVYAVDDDEHSPERVLLLGELRRAILRDELTLFYQPLVSFATGNIVGMEALVRWNHPRRGLLPPGLFVPIAERSGVIKPLHEWVLRNSLRQVKAWSELWDKPIVAVNTSMPNVLDPRFRDTVERVLREAEVGPESLRIEVTESVIMADPERARKVVADLRTMGAEVSIDDFGTGYSSLGYLQRLDVNEIKIDKSFVIGIADDRSRAAIVRATIDLGHHFGLHVVAEGVEDQRTWDVLNTTPCDTAQGYHISPPLPANEVVRSLIDRGWIRPGSERGFRVA